ncbi:MAG: hypothetical protein E6790_08680 [Veillonella sp.]|uniref:hypothetical protein n=1 Tax=Veillonella sp. TaxID=1926307 RepID=UPI0028FE5906|nr:hypothetical protein [Veillonella sp.]MDU1827532.1 hypothetical protein [Veillonella sp.]
MPINWNEIDRLKLEHIQQQEAAKTKYEEGLKTYKEKLSKKGFFDKLFNYLEMPERSYLPEFNYIYNISNSFCIRVYIENILITDPYECLQSEYADQIIKYLGLNKDNKYPFYNAYKIDGTEENRKKLDKVVALIEKYTSEKQKEAEAYIDNFINNKEGK